MPKMPCEKAFLPIELHRVWEIFQELSPHRKTGWSLGLIPYTEIAAWLSYTETKLSVTERKLLESADRIWLNKMNEKEEKNAC